MRGVDLQRISRMQHVATTKHKTTRILDVDASVIHHPCIISSTMCHLRVSVSYIPVLWCLLGHPSPTLQTCDHHHIGTPPCFQRVLLLVYVLSVNNVYVFVLRLGLPSFVLQ